MHRTDSLQTRADTAGFTAPAGRIDVCIPARDARPEALLRTLLSVSQGAGIGQVHVLGADPTHRLAAATGTATVQWCAEMRDAASRTPWTLVLAPGDELQPAGLTSLIDGLSTAPPDVALVYADEELAYPEGIDLLLKPAWSPVFHRHLDYVGTSWAARSTLLADADFGDPCGAFANLARRFGSFGRVAHLPATLVRSGRAVRQRASVESAGAPPAWPHVSVIIPSKLARPDLVGRCLRGLLQDTDYPSLEVVLALNGGARTPTEFQGRIRVVEISAARFNWASVNNEAAAACTGELLLFLNDDVAITDRGWLQTLVRLLSDTGAAAVGPLLTYPDGRIQHVGMAVVYHGSGTRHVLHGSRPGEGAGAWLTSVPREVAAVTGAAMLVDRRAFESLGGFDEQFELVCNDTDFCLRLGAAAHSVLIDPRVRLVHEEKVTRSDMDEMPDVLRFWNKWEPRLRRGDAFAHPDLDGASAGWDPQAGPRLHPPALRIDPR